MVVATGSLELDSMNVTDVGLVGGGLVRATANVIKLNFLCLHDVAVKSTDKNYFHEIANSLVWITAPVDFNLSKYGRLRQH